MQARRLLSQWRLVDARSRIALLRLVRLVQTSFRRARLVRTSFRASGLSLSSPLKLLLRIYLLEGEIERLLNELRHVPGGPVNAENFREPIELLLQAFPGRETEIVDIGTCHLDAPRGLPRRTLLASEGTLWLGCVRAVTSPLRRFKGARGLSSVYTNVRFTKSEPSSAALMSFKSN